MDIYAPFVQRVGKFNVVRDDVFTGGTKARVLTNLLADVKETEIVYAADRYGYAGLALAQACEQHNKRAILFFNDDPAEPKPFLETRDHPSADIKIKPNAKHQIELFDLAEEFAQKAKHRKIYPVGFCTQKFQSALTRYARALPVKPKEIWALAGSGTLIRSLREAWPEATIHAVSMGFPQTDTSVADHVYTVRETPEQEAEQKPDYPSAAHYDAKIWHFVEKHASEDALIWNVAA